MGSKLKKFLKKITWDRGMILYVRKMKSDVYVGNETCTIILGGRSMFVVSRPNGLTTARSPGFPLSEKLGKKS